MTFASHSDEGERPSRPRIGPVVVGGTGHDDPTPRSSTPIPPLFLRSAELVGPAAAPVEQEGPAVPEDVASAAGTMAEAAPPVQATEAVFVADGEAATDEPPTWEESSGDVLDASDASLAIQDDATGHVEEIPQDGEPAGAPYAEEPGETATEAAHVPWWIKAVDRRLESEIAESDSDDEVAFTPTSDSPSLSTDEADRFEPDQDASAWGEQLPISSEDTSAGLTEPPRWRPEAHEDDLHSEGAEEEVSPVEFGIGETYGDDAIDEEWPGELEGTVAAEQESDPLPLIADEPVAEGVSGTGSPASEPSTGYQFESTEFATGAEPGEIIGEQPVTDFRPEPSTAVQLAARLEGIAARLRESGSDALSGAGADPLGAIIAAYLLGVDDRQPESEVRSD